MDGDWFLGAALKHLRQAGFEVGRHGPDQLVVSRDGDVGLVVSLGDMRELHNRSGSFEEVVEAVIQVWQRATAGKLALDWNCDHERLRIHLVPTGLLHTLPARVVTRQVSPFFVETLVVDSPEFYRYVTKNDVDLSGRDLDAFWMNAQFNMSAFGPAPTLKNVEGVSLQVWEGPYAADYAWHKASAQKSAAVAIPDENFGILVVDPSESASKLLSIVVALAGESVQSPITDQIHLIKDREVVGFVKAFRIGGGRS